MTTPTHGLYGPGDGILGTDIDLRGCNLPDRTILALGALTADMYAAGEAKGYERAAKAMQGMRVLLVDADVALSQAAENDEDVAMFHRAWKARLRLVLETGEYPGLTTKLLDDPRDKRIGGGSEPS